MRYSISPAAKIMMGAGSVVTTYSDWNISQAPTSDIELAKN
jgi:hypothetical protein